MTEPAAMTPEAAYDAIAKLARDHALIHAAAGGVIVVVHPDTQRKQGIYTQIQHVHGLGPHPSRLEAEGSDLPAEPPLVQALERAGQQRLLP